MNPNIRRLPSGPQSPNELALLGWVSPLNGRLHMDEIRAIANVKGFDADNPMACARILLARAWHARRERGAVLTRANALRHSAAKLSGPALSALLEHHLRETAAPEQLTGDLRALRRDLDLDALLEREAERAEHQGERLELLAEAMGGLIAANARLGPDMLATVPLVELLEALLQDEPRPATRRAAVRALVQVARAATPFGEDPPSRDALFKLIADPGAGLWARRAALEIHSVLSEADAQSLLSGCAEATGEDAFIIRARAVDLLAQREESWAVRLLRVAAKDPSETVRFAAASGLAHRLSLGDNRCFAPLDRLLRRDANPSVRRWVAYVLRLAGASALPPLTRALEDAHSAVVEQALESLAHLVRTDVPLLLSTEEAVEQLMRTAEPAVAQAASELLSLIRSRKSRLRELAEALGQLRSGDTRQVDLPPNTTARELAEALVPHASQGFGFTLDPRGGPDASGARVRIQRGDLGATALWRLLHEVRHPHPAKRQGYSHTVGRANLGSVQVPPGILAEENATGVPGQRVRNPTWRGWAPPVPMVDDALHALQQRELRIVSASGVTTLRAPTGLPARLRAWWRLTWHFSVLDRQRNASLSATTPEGRRAYVSALRKLGFGVQGPDTGPGTPFLAIDPLAYALSMGANTVPHLVVTVLLLASLVYGRVAAVRRQVITARRRIPLSIGGWGTRGKSGTERLKAALFEGHGIPLLSKTTGCEAMVLHAPPGGRAMELFLFRPFDKATIWEQARVTQLGAALGSRVFLWECMGLNPVYVDLLQRGWMNDDLVTLTNAYPDHEDIQGPTGQDVARVIGSFSPRKALVITAERSMLPILREEAARHDSAILPLSRAETELVPADLLARMPHAEHPGNVALVARMAEELGLDPVEAVGLMAEHVLPDLGALVVSPTVPYAGRQITFVNGMSANDEVSFRHNWRYTGFADAPADPTLWLVTVVNNRADRVPRSRVFARILVEQAHANRHLIIGTNLEGMRAYIDEALAQMLEPIDAPQRLFPRLRLSPPAELGLRLATDATDRAREAWSAACSELPPVASGLEAARKVVERLRPLAKDLDPHQLGLAEALLEAAARHTAAQGALELPVAEMKARYAELFRASILYHADPSATGDELVHALALTAPPNSSIRAMGAQNIKGTGLDFAYQWVYLRQAHAAGTRLRTGDAPARAAALAALEALPLDSAIVIEQVLHALEALRDDPTLADRAQHLQERARGRFTEVLANRGQRRSRSRLGTALERLVDPFDAIARTARAKQVLDDLAARRISHKRAQAELKRLSARQKGGWWGKG